MAEGSLKVRRLDASNHFFEQQLVELTRYEPSTDRSISDTVREILADVRSRGDQAVLDFTRKFDRFDPKSAQDLRIDAMQLQAALESLPGATRAALHSAADRVRRYHEHQRGTSWHYTEADGTRLGQKITPLDRVGLYVPGGKAAYPSSVLMNAIPAKVAGVSQIQMVVPTPDGIRNPAVLAAAAVAGIDEVYCMGGAQAVGALAFGTETVPAVDKIVGPGNAFVAEAKRQVFGTVGIDMIAGPSEILVLCDGSVSPDWVAMDLFSQAEHDEMAQAILLCPDAVFLEAVQASIARLLPEMPRRDVIAQSLKDRGALIKVADMAQACDIANRIAPEHLEIIAADSAVWIEKIRHAGAIFVGPYASESLGDYCAGPNHVLPTMRTARFSSPLGVYDFQKRSSLIQISREGALALGPVAGELADAEGLQAHARSARMRLDEDAQQLLPAATEKQTGGSPAVSFAFSEHVRNMHAYPVGDASGFLKLDAMENPYTLSPELRTKLAQRLAALNINRYPVPSYRQLKSEIARVFGVPEGFPVVLGNGSDELITMLSLATAGTQRPTLGPWPSFAMYKLTAALAGNRFVPVPLTADFKLDTDATLVAIAAEQPALVYIAYPNNPTGACFDEVGIEQIIRSAPGLVVLDEAYFPFAGKTWMNRLPEFANLVVMRTVSKIGLAGIRLGYLAAAPAITEQLEKVRPPYNISVLDEAAALFALEHHRELDEQAARITAQRAGVCQALSQLPGVEVFETLTNFVLIRVPDAAKVDATLRARKVLVRNAHSMDPALANCLRITISTEDENKEMLAAMAAAIGAVA